MVKKKTVIQAVLGSIGVLATAGYFFAKHAVDEIVDSARDRIATYGDIGDSHYPIVSPVVSDPFPKTVTVKSSQVIELEKMVTESEGTIVQINRQLSELDTLLANLRKEVPQDTSKRFEYHKAKNAQGKKSYYDEHRILQRYELSLLRFEHSLFVTHSTVMDQSVEDAFKTLDSVILEEKLRAIPFSAQEKTYGPLRDLATSVFTSLSGKSLPTSLNMAFGAIGRDGVVGEYDFSSESIKLGDFGYEATLLAALHEMGHAIYSGTEHYAVARLKDFPIIHFNQKPESVKPLEEAAAYLFSVAGAEQVAQKHPDLRNRLYFVLNQERKFFLDEYSRGSDEVHRVGWAIAQAMLEQYGSAKNAFNTILSVSSLESLEQPVLDRMQTYRNETKNDLVTRDDAVQTTFDEMKKRYTEMTKRFPDDMFAPITLPDGTVIK